MAKASLSAKKRLQNVSDHFDALATDRGYWIKKAKSFYDEDMLFMRELIPSGLNILEIGSGIGNLLHGLNPSKGIGVDLSKNMVELASQNFSDCKFIHGNISDPKTINKLGKNFDAIVISDTLGFLEDIESTLEDLHKLCSPNTRLVVAYYAPMWDPLLKLASKFGLKMPTKEAALLDEKDISAMLDSSGYEILRTEKKILLPFNLFGVGRIINRFLAPLPLFSFFCIRNYVVARSLQKAKENLPDSATVIIPCRNEKGNIFNALERIPRFCKNIEVIFTEGHSTDGTWKEIQKAIKTNKELTYGLKIRAIQQSGKGKADAVFSAFNEATGDVLIILDGDLTVPPEELTKFWKKISSGKAEYVHGTRLVYPMEKQAMRFLNFIGNRFFSLLFTWLLGQRFTDTLCGTKVIRKHHYLEAVRRNRMFGDFDPFGDFFLIFGASRLSLKIVEIPIRYRARSYGETQISRFKHGLLLLRMVVFAFFKIKAI